MGQAMVTDGIKRFRIQSVLSSFTDCVFLTLTTADVCSLFDLRQRWRRFRHDYFRSVKHPAYVQIYEPHPKGHGWHVHVVINRSYLPVDLIRIYSKQAGFGRIHIERCRNGSDVACYLAKYLTKSVKIAKELGIKRVRLVNVSRGLTRLCDCESDTCVTFAARYIARQYISCLRDLPPIGKYKYILYYLLFGCHFAPYNSSIEHYLDVATSIYAHR